MHSKGHRLSGLLLWDISGVGPDFHNFNESKQPLLVRTNFVTCHMHCISLNGCPACFYRPLILCTDTVYWLYVSSVEVFLLTITLCVLSSHITGRLYMTLSREWAEHRSYCRSEERNTGCMHNGAD